MDDLSSCAIEREDNGGAEILVVFGFACCMAFHCRLRELI